MRYSFLIGIFFLVGCQSNQTKQSVIIEEVSMEDGGLLPGPKFLSEWELFEDNLSDLRPTEGLVPYDLNTPLFTDYASKLRFVKLPEGTNASYENFEVMNFPKGTILVKNFFYPALDEPKEKNLIETRLLIHEEAGWNALTYIWNEDQSDAELALSGATLPVSWKGDNGELKNVSYSVPNLVQCKSCHEKKGRVIPIGPTARQLNREYPYSSMLVTNQIDQWNALGLLEGVPSGTLPKLPVWDDASTGTLTERARAWLEINCAHCHRAEGPAKNTGLHLLASETDPYKLGINKPPVAAGRGSAGLRYGIVPGKPEESILVHRIKSLDPGVMMPELGRKTVHEEGVALVSEWIRSMSGPTD